MRSDWVDPQPAFRHVRDLYARGMPIARMSEVSGLCGRTMRGFLRGTVREAGRDRPVTGITPKVLGRVLAIEFAPPWTPDGFSPAKFRAVRESQRISRNALAKSAGLCPETIQSWETGRCKPTRKENLDAVLRLLGVEWEAVSGPPEKAAEDAFEMVFSDGIAGPDADWLPKYPCHVCGNVFESRTLLATHPHPKKKVPA